MQINCNIFCEIRFNFSPLHKIWPSFKKLGQNFASTWKVCTIHTKLPRKTPKLTPNFKITYFRALLSLNFKKIL